MAEAIHTTSNAIYLREVLSDWEKQTRQRSGQVALMDQAGAAAARVALAMAGQRRGKIMVVAGAGNNAGDGLEAARCLLQQGIACRVVGLVAPNAYQGDAARALQRFSALGGIVEQASASLTSLNQASVIIDAIYGTGLSRAPEGIAKTAIAAINAAAQNAIPVLALDLPSGLVSDTGATLGDVVKATRTLTFLGLKPGLLTGAGPDCAGDIALEALEPSIDLPTPGFVSAPVAFKELLQRRKRDSNKGSFGTLAVIGGAKGTAGAALLSARASLYAGAGKVFVEQLGESLGVDPMHPELMLRTRIDLEHVDAVVIGPGLGESNQARRVLRSVIGSALPAVFDADALNLISKDRILQKAMASRTAPSIITPHPLEAARLLDQDVKSLQADRIKAALHLADHFRAVAILKGAGSIIASPDGRWAINPTGNPGLASGGTGDVLSGVLGGLSAQRKDAFQTALAGCYLHGQAADELVANGIGPIGLTASELIPAIRAALNRHTLA
jgi:hydroxyethylthiazole kinase-like uncharacterized protein yjeF